MEVQSISNETLTVVLRKSKGNMTSGFRDDETEDNEGALYYVIVVVLLYGMSIVMMIISHIRKNKMDTQLGMYIKEMELIRQKQLLVCPQTDSMSNKFEIQDQAKRVNSLILKSPDLETVYSSEEHESSGPDTTDVFHPKRQCMRQDPCLRSVDSEENRGNGIPLLTPPWQAYLENV